jgi:type I restriction enzyme, S subunit
MRDWTEEKLGENVSHKKGFAFKSESFQSSGRPIIKVTNFTENSVSHEAVEYVDDQTYNDHIQYRLASGDVVIQTVGSWPSNPDSVVGKVIRVPRRLDGALLNQNAVILYPNSKIDSSFLYYLLRSNNFKGYIINTAQGAANQASITLDSIFRFQFYLPNSPQQKRIAAILSAYDELIENNKRRIALLEKLAEEIYREWFVRLRFPDHEKVKVVKGVPQGWRMAELRELAAVNSSSIGRRDKPETILYVDISSVSTNRVDEVTTYTSADAPGRARRLVKHGDIIWSSVRPANRAYCLIYEPPDNLIVSTGFAVIRPKTSTPFSFLFFAVTSDSFVDQMTIVAKGAAYPAASFDDFERAMLLVPSDELLKNFHEKTEPLFRQKHVLEKQSERLRKSRDMLLPRLLSGKLSVEQLDIQFPPGMAEELEPEPTAAVHA